MTTPNAGFIIPSTFDELQRRVLAEDPPCTCDNCDYDSYTCKVPHADIEMDVHETNRHGYKLCSSPHLLQHSGIWPTHQVIEARDLAQRAIEYFDCELHQLNDLQSKAVNRFKRYMKDWGNRLGWADGPRAVSKARMESLLRCFNEIFWFGDVPKINFIWDRNLDSNTLAETKVHYEKGTITIRMHPTKYCEEDQDDVSRRKVHRLGTLGHESTHAFVEGFACMLCSRYPDNVGEGGHGIVFALLAAKFENAFLRFFDIEIDLGKFHAMRCHMRLYPKLPSICNLRECNMLPETVDDTSSNVS